MRTALSALMLTLILGGVLPGAASGADLIIKNGGPALKKSPIMPAMGKTLKDDQVKDVVAYLRSLAK